MNRQARKEELDKRLKAVNAANALMAIFGYHLDQDSEKKAREWEQEYNAL